jgi:phosphoglycerol transferase MdoB-like AlkP superfamily enzyme
MYPKSRFFSLLLLYSLFVGFSLAIRTILIVKTWHGLDGGMALLARIYAVGFFFDTVTFSYLSLPLVAWVLLVPDRVFNSRRLRWFAYGLYIGFIYFLLIDAAAEYLFFEEFGTRFNFIAIDYLIYTTEVVRNIRESYPVGWVFGVLLLASGLIFIPLKPWINRSCGSASIFRSRVTVGGAFVLIPVLSFLFVNLSAAHISENNYANEMAANGIYSLASAFRSKELDFDHFYAIRRDDLVLSRLRRNLRENATRFVTGDVHDITRETTGRGVERKRNVIVIVEESLSAEFLGVSGNLRGLTPNLDRLARESMYFTRIYATGTRTVRGLEAITLSVPPLPGRSIIKRPDNGDFFSWGSLMRKKGYETKFLYAGYGYFDNMNAFFSGNGFDIVDRKDFVDEEITFSNAWGVCDEDLLNRVIRESGASYARRRPFFSVVMTTSNHRPFTYPEGKIDIPSHTGRDGGVKYADYAIGRFLERAKKEPWFDDTLFVIVADHCAGSAGKVALPVDKYHIPLFIYSPGHIRPVKIDKLASQIDIAPTVLALLNMHYRFHFFGKDIRKMSPSQERAFLSTYQRLGYLTKGKLGVLDPKRKIESYRVRWDTGELVPEPPRGEEVEDMIAYYQGANYIYKNRLNREGPKLR